MEEEMNTPQQFQLIPNQLNSILLALEELIDQEIFVTKEGIEKQGTLLEITVRGNITSPKILLLTSIPEMKILEIRHNSKLMLQDCGDHKYFIINKPDFKIPIANKKKSGLTVLTNHFISGKQWTVSTEKSYYSQKP